MFSVIDNRGPNTLRDYLSAALRNAREVRIAVAFVTNSGLDAIETALTRAARSGTVRFLTGLYEGFTEPAALRSLVRRSNQHGHRFQVRLSTRPKFHPKLYLIEHAKSATAISGSSNLTADGLSGEGEYNIVHKGKSKAEFDRGAKYFAAEWEEEATLLTARIVKRYEERRRGEGSNSKLTASIAEILELGRKSKPRSSPDSEKQKRSTRCWCDAMIAWCEPETKLMIRRETDWDRKGYEWYSTGESNLRRHDRLVLFDYAEKPAQVRLVRIVDQTTLPRATPNGKNFVAYQPLNASRGRKLTPVRIAALKRIGAYLPKSNVGRRVIAAKKWEQVCELLGIRSVAR
jgi:HKD family nuclease